MPFAVELEMCGSLAKDFHKLMKSIASFSDNQAEVCHYEENLQAFQVEIIPNDGVYCGGRFKFQVNLEDYPYAAPSVTCETRIYHPNIDHGSGEVCLNLFEEWNATNSLEDCVQGLLFLLYNPNLEDPLSVLFDSESENYDEFTKNVWLSLQGGEVEGFGFERNLVNEDSVEDKDNEFTNCRSQKEAEPEVNDAKATQSGVMQDMIELNKTAGTGNTETSEDSKLNSKCYDTGDFILGKIHPHRTEGEMTGLVKE